MATWKKVDKRIRALIEEGVALEQRSLILIVGDRARDQVVTLHQILSRARVRARPSILWCYKNDLGFSTHRAKQQKAMRRAMARGLDVSADSPFQLLATQSDIQWCYYRDTARILGSTFGSLVLQDFEALTPNILARTIETVEGGGLVILLVGTITSLKQLYTLTMDAHSSYRQNSALTAKGGTSNSSFALVPRFNERFILSLVECSRCIFVDDELNLLPLGNCDDKPSRRNIRDANSTSNVESLLQTLRGRSPAEELIAKARTLDQAHVLLSLIEALTERCSGSVATLTAPRGRGKSATMGLCLAAAVWIGYSNIMVTAPRSENLKTVFQFGVIGLKALGYEEHVDFQVDCSAANNNHDGPRTPTAIILQARRSVSSSALRQTIRYADPTSKSLFTHAELVLIDEAAAIPIPAVRSLVGACLTFLTSTVSGYEGTGRALQLKLMHQLRKQHAAQRTSSHVDSTRLNGNVAPARKSRTLDETRTDASNSNTEGKMFSTPGWRELTLKTPIRYAEGDAIEEWLHRCLCMDSVPHPIAPSTHGLAPPLSCELYHVDRDSLFSYHALSEALLQRIMALYTTAHYRNTPNDLQMLSDAPAHRLFVLLGPEAAAGESSSIAEAKLKRDNGQHGKTPSASKVASDSGPSGRRQDTSSTLPNVLAVLQVAFEGAIVKKEVRKARGSNEQAPGDLIPWTVASQFCDDNFPRLIGARIVRIVTHPDAQHMGYGSRALELLAEYFETAELQALQKMEEPNAPGAQGDTLHSEAIRPRSVLPPLLTPLRRLSTPLIDWIGASFGLTPLLCNFWTRAGYDPVYLRQTQNDITGDHSVILLREVKRSKNEDATDADAHSEWLETLASNFRARFIRLLAFNCFNHLDTALCMTLLGAHSKKSQLYRHVLHRAEATVNATQPSLQGEVQKPLNVVSLNEYDVVRLERFISHSADYRNVVDLVPQFAECVFSGKLTGIGLLELQAALLLGIGLQRRELNAVAQEIGLSPSHGMALFCKMIRKFAKHIVDGAT